MLLSGAIPHRELLPESQARVPMPSFRSAHLVGACGAGMKALAELLMGLGWKVTGSDLQAPEVASEMFARRGLRIHHGHHGRFLPSDADVLVYSPAVSSKNPERQMAAHRGIPELSYSQMLGYLMRDKTGVSIAGTHGKSTTTAMTAFVLTDAGLSPSAIIGAGIREIDANGWAGQGPLFVVESCEYQRSFLNLSPRYAAILGIEPDHFDCFQNLDETITAFAEFAQRVPQDGVLVIRGDCQATRSACMAAVAKVETFSLQPDADWWAADMRPSSEGVRFRIFHQGEYFSEISLRIPGEHNVLNALAAAAICHQAGALPSGIRDGLHRFPGIQRRFEPVGSWRGVTLIDDYAHHPTAVAATLKTARERFPERRIWCVFQPHQVSRTRALLPEFAASFTDADEVLVVPVFAARERVRQEPQEVSVALVAGIQTVGGSARYSATLDQTLATLEDGLRPGDVLITMGAGDIAQVHHAFTRRLQPNYTPRRTPGPLYLAEDRWTGPVLHPAQKRR